MPRYGSCRAGRGLKVNHISEIDRNPNRDEAAEALEVLRRWAATADPTDGGHLDAANTRKIGEALVPVVKGILQI